MNIAHFVFIPFCKIKCTYCDFNVYAHLARWMEAYADAVAHEINTYPQTTLRAKTIYFGAARPR